ncbi:unnamed protein product [Bursaphelenchus xylophilus]|uniref:(pine wood nematode) hypothetical protein n=1 Tax=Bursaphelenchus xylophilus TaxID=6326 RepID=A0A1I7SQB5_BURXY|nr:unnamed protein product [Bursaphelenchus xylophilus]CAG9109695.1 unnamed protein product [Bursaphelenchus xylophilus]
MRVLRQRPIRVTYTIDESSDETDVDCKSTVSEGELIERTVNINPFGQKDFPIWQCYSCELGFRDHLDFYSHVTNMHSEFLDVKMKARISRPVKKGRVFCGVCRDIFDSHEEHETIHYSTKLGKGAMIECTNCYKTFDTVDQMKAHHSKAHTIVRPSIYQSCCVCKRLFNNRNVRDQHFITHLPFIVQKTMEKVDQMHVFMGELSIGNQCPLCGFIVSTRKSLRQHAIFQHCLRSFDDLQKFLGPKLEGIDKNELKIVKKVISNPDLLWKRSRQTVSECDTGRVKQEVVKVKAMDDLDASLMSKKVKLEPNSEEEIILDENFRESQKRNQLRAYMLQIGVDPENPTKCRICGEEQDDLILLEVHLAMKHINLAKNRSAIPSSEDSDSSYSST